MIPPSSTRHRIEERHLMSECQPKACLINRKRCGPGPGNLHTQSILNTIPEPNRHNNSNYEIVEPFTTFLSHIIYYENCTSLNSSLLFAYHEQTCN